MNLETVLLFLFTVAFITRLSLRMAGPGQSLVIFQDGRAIKVAKRTVLLLPFIQTSKLVDTSIKTQLIPAFYDAVAPHVALVQGTFEYCVFDPLRAAGDDNLGRSIECILTVALKRLLEEASIAQCLTEKSKLEVRALEMANLKSASLGVSLRSLTINSFPVHFQLLLRITTMPYLIYWQIVEEVQ